MGTLRDVYHRVIYEIAEQMKGSESMIVDCPYCNKEVDIDDSNLEYLNNENYTKLAKSPRL